MQIHHEYRTSLIITEVCNTVYYGHLLSLSQTTAEHYQHFTFCTRNTTSKHDR